MLRVKIKDIEFSSPILTASGTYGYGNEVGSLVNVAELGGIVTKSVTCSPREGNPPQRIFETSSGMLNSIGLANVGVDVYCSEKLPFLNKLDTNVIINIAGTSIENYIKVLKKLESSNGNQIGYEINISCPNVKDGMEFAVSPKLTESLTKELRKLTDKLLIIKLSPNVTSIVDIAMAAEQGGADAVSAINTVVGMGINISTRKPHLSTIYGGLSGPAIKPIAVASVNKIYSRVSIPIIGIGGIASCDDIIEFILAGADLVEIGTMNYQDPSIGVKIKNDLIEYCNQHKISNIQELKGKMIVE